MEAVFWTAVAEVGDAGRFPPGVAVLGRVILCLLYFVEKSRARWALNLWFSCFLCVGVLGRGGFFKGSVTEGFSTQLFLVFINHTCILSKKLSKQNDRDREVTKNSLSCSM